MLGKLAQRFCATFVAVCSFELTMPPEFPVKPEDRQSLLRLARMALEHAVVEHRPLELPAQLAATFSTPRGCFVTLTKGRKLRGCIGNIYPDLPLAAAVATNACRAAQSDPRFSPVTSEELPLVEIEISILDEPRPLAFSSPAELLDKLCLHRDGVVLKSGFHRATFLPQVWESLPDPGDFLSHLASKAGLPPDAWRDAKTEILTYQVTAFSEFEPDHVSSPASGG
jgi:uncharacterized protein